MATYARSLTYKVNDRKPDLVLHTQIDEKGTPQDLTLAVSAKFYLRDTSDGSLKVDGESATLGGTAGTITYEWAAGDLDTRGDYEAYAIIYWDASSTLPETTGACEVLVRNPWEVME